MKKASEKGDFENALIQKNPRNFNQKAKSREKDAAQFHNDLNGYHQKTIRMDGGNETI